MVALKTKLSALCRVFLRNAVEFCFVFFSCDSQFDFSDNCLLLELGCLCKRTHCCLGLGNMTRNCSVPSLFTPAGSQPDLCHEAIAKPEFICCQKEEDRANNQRILYGCLSYVHNRG